MKVKQYKINPSQKEMEKTFSFLSAVRQRMLHFPEWRKKLIEQNEQ
jgi:hypothetical protein